MVTAPDALGHGAFLATEGVSKLTAPVIEDSLGARNARVTSPFL